MLASRLFLAACLLCTSNGGVVHVQTTGDDVTCSALSPCQTISRGLEVAGRHGTVIIGPGTYTGTGNCGVVVSLPVVITSSHGASSTIIDCQHQARCMVIAAPTTIESVTLRRGFGGSLASCEGSERADMEPQEELIQRKPSQRAQESVTISLQRGAASESSLREQLEALAPETLQRLIDTAQAVRQTSRDKLFDNVPVHAESVQVSRQPLDTEKKESKANLASPRLMAPNSTLAGGCLLVIASQLDLRHAVVLHGISPFGGGLAAINGTSALFNVTFTANRAGQGGGAFVSGGSLLLRRTTFNSNHATRCTKASRAFPQDLENAALGAGVFADSARVIVSESSLTNNFVTARWETRAYLDFPVAAGGGMFCRSVNLTVTESDISTNLAAAFASRSRSRGAIAAGGGLVCIECQLFLTSVRLVANALSCLGRYCRSQGGGVHTVGGALSLSHARIGVNNISCVGRQSTAKGGSLWSEGGTASLFLVHMNANRLFSDGDKASLEGGSIWNEGGSLVVSNCSLVSNILHAAIASGAGIWSTGGTVVLRSSDCSWHQLTAFQIYAFWDTDYSGKGACLFAERSNVSLFTSRVANNVLQAQKGWGSGCCVNGGSLVVRGCVVQNNTLVASVGYGGGVLAQGIDAPINIFMFSSVVSDNRLVVRTTMFNSEHQNPFGKGAGVRVDYGCRSLHIEDSHFDGNRMSSSLDIEYAQNDGGGLSVVPFLVSGMMNSEFPAYIVGSTINNNTIEEGNGAGAAFSRSVIMQRSVVEGNAANCATPFQLGCRGVGLFLAVDSHVIANAYLFEVSISYNIAFALSSGGGGGLCVLQFNQTNINSCSIRSNRVQVRCGGIAACAEVWTSFLHGAGLYFYSGLLHLENSLVVENFGLQRVDVSPESWVLGIGIYVRGATDLTGLSIKSSMVSRNIGVGRVVAGGGLYIVGVMSMFQITDSIINENECGGGFEADGGGMYLDLIGPVIAASISRSSISSNSAIRAGALQVKGASKFTVHASTILNNRALLAGGLMVTDATVFVLSSSYQGNNSALMADEVLTDSPLVRFMAYNTTVRTAGDDPVVSFGNDIVLFNDSVWTSPAGFMFVLNDLGLRGAHLPGALFRNLRVRRLTVNAIRYTPPPSAVPKRMLTRWQCPLGAECPGGAVVWSTEDFWGSFDAVDGVVHMSRCPVRYCCVDDVCPTFDACFANRAGPLCGDCAPGYSEDVFGTQCSPDANCNNLAWQLPLGLVVSGLVVLALLAFRKRKVAGIVLDRQRGSSDSGRDGAELKITLFFFQLLPITVTTATDSELNIAIPVRIVTAICLTDFGILGWEDSSNGYCPVAGFSAVSKIAGRAVFPAMCICWALVAFGARAVRTRMKAHSGYRGYGAESACLVFLLGLLFSNICRVTMEMLFCVPIQSKRVLFRAGSTECFNSLQVFIMIFIVPLLVAYPGVVVFFCYKWRSKVRTKGCSTVWLDAVGRVLWSPYDSSRMLTQSWEAILILTRLVTTITFVFGQGDPFWQTACTTMVLVVLLVLQAAIAPFKRARANTFMIGAVMILLVLCSWEVGVSVYHHFGLQLPTSISTAFAVAGIAFLGPLAYGTFMHVYPFVVLLARPLLGRKRPARDADDDVELELEAVVWEPQLEDDDLEEVVCA